ncbi:DNA repair and recombination protein rhm52 [Nasonia vitripennis]|uniref:DNA repair protein RAD52-like protein n=1 Tax=Nasonia vitripennis TaxID=7425 RepID=A0A7M7GDN3_NASVI|nr:DNA repair and recombination protein rhm52 [Nasonia vitripennis]
MSCIKFPSTSNDVTKTSNKEDANGYFSVNSQLIDTANNVFGNNNWSHSITNQTVDFVDYIAGKYHAGCATTVRVQLENGIFHEGMGYSHLEGSSKGSALQKVRLDSFNMALKQVFLCFGIESAKKLKCSIPVRTISPVPKEEVIPKTTTQKERSISPVVPPVITKNTEVFDEAISVSQTDALMDIVDLDQLFDKSPKSSSTNNTGKDFAKTSVFKPIAPSGVLAVKDKNSNIVDSKKLDGVKSSLPISSNSQHADKAAPGLKKENKEIPKPVVHTAMTEEEMRLERKRKQREMQEEFKRKQESKKMHVDSGSKPPPNPRY